MSEKKSPWGRQRVEEAWAEIDGIRPYGGEVGGLAQPRSTTAWGRPITADGPTKRDFTEVGLSEADADAALDGYMSGKFMSFEDACLSTALFRKDGPYTMSLNEAAMRRKARKFSSELSEPGKG